MLSAMRRLMRWLVDQMVESEPTSPYIDGAWMHARMDELIRSRRRWRERVELLSDCEMEMQ